MKTLTVLAIIVYLINGASMGESNFFKARDFLNDEVLSIEAVPGDVVSSRCTCKCCEKKNEGVQQPPCPTDIVLAVDSSACFRDHHGRTMRFLKKLVYRIGRENATHYGENVSRLAIMQFSSDIQFALNLSSFKNYTDPSSSKALRSEIRDVISGLKFLGEGTFLNEALNATVNHFLENSRPKKALERFSPPPTRKVVILVTNGNSHPSVTSSDIDNSVEALEKIGATVIPIAVTKRCFSPSYTWSDGLCPDPKTLNKLASVGKNQTLDFDTDRFLEMASSDTIVDILTQLKCFPPNSGLVSDVCNNCTCSCEFSNIPDGPPGQKGAKGEPGEGTQGERGERGEKGERGENGVKGRKGDDGEPGPRGERGIKGDRGEEGVIGDKGALGEKGDPGPKGDTGEQGETGLKGDKGSDGVKGGEGGRGEKGNQGEKGTEGREGVKGEKGSSGRKGETGFGDKGEPGIRGLKGEKGSHGSKGDLGFKGLDGKNGLCGQPGPAGRRGEKGSPGSDAREGPTGPDGIQGVQGYPGVPGPKGEMGVSGEIGYKGEPGVPGERGPAGLEGPRGPKGMKGEPSNIEGEKGSKGETGPKGKRGEDGFNGLTGPQGPRGIQGVKGQRGLPGPPGEFNEERIRPLISEIVRELIPRANNNDSTSLTPTVSPSTTPPTTLTPKTPFDEVCSGVPDFGNCNEPGENLSLPMYYWSATEQRCILFTYRLCPGDNIFDTEDKCLQRCKRITIDPSPTPPHNSIDICKNASLDVVLAVDVSATMNEKKFRQVRSFLNAFIGRFLDVGSEGLRVSTITYSERSRIEFGFINSGSRRRLLSEIGKMRYNGNLTGNSYTGKAIRRSYKILRQASQKREYPATEVIVVITDGRSRDNVELPSTEAKNIGIINFAVGVDQAETIELNKIVSEPQISHRYYVESYDDLMTISDAFVESICREAGGNFLHAATEVTTAPEELNTEENGSVYNYEEEEAFF